MMDLTVKHSIRALTIWASACILLLSAEGCHHQIEPDPTEDVKLLCRVQYPTVDVNAELDDKLSSEKDRYIRQALEKYIEPIFYPTVGDIDFSFFNQRQHGERTFHKTDVMNASEKIFPLDIVASDYRFGGAANLSPNLTVSLTGGETEKELLLQQVSGTSDPHRAGIFTFRGRSYIKKDGGVQEFTSALCMANAAAALILNRDSCDVTGISATFEGFADSFNVLDSLYSFDRNTVVNTDPIDLTSYYGDGEADATKSVWAYDITWTLWTRTPLMVCGASFPSRNFGSDVIDGKVVIWTIHLLVTLADGSITRNDIFIGQPLQAGHLKIIKGWLLRDGSFTPTPPLVPQGGPSYEPGPDPPTPPSPGDETVVGVSVMLNWQPGATYEHEL